MRNAPALHGRDHCPGGADPIPCMTGAEFAWVEATTPQTIGATTDITISWDTHMNTNAAVFGTGSVPQILAGNTGVVILELKVQIEDVGAKVAATLAGDLLAHLDGSSGVWFWPGDDAINTDPLNASQEFGYKDIAVAQADGITRSIQATCHNADLVAHDFLYGLLHVAFIPGVNELVQVYP